MRSWEDRPEERSQLADAAWAGVDLARAAAFRLGEVSVDPKLKRLTAKDGREELIEPKVMKVLVVLANAKGEVLTRDDLMNLCWPGVIVGDDALSRVIARIRRISEGIANRTFHVETLASVGYRLVQSQEFVETAANDAAPAFAPAKPSGPISHTAPAARPRWLVMSAVWLGLAAVLAIGGYWGLQLLRSPDVYRLQVGRVRSAGGAVPDQIPEMIQRQVGDEFAADKLIAMVTKQPDFTLLGIASRDGAKLHYAFSIEDGLGGQVGGWTQDTSIDPLRSATQVSMHASELLRCWLVGLAEYRHPISHNLRSLYLQVCGGGTSGRRLDIARTITQDAPNFAGGWSSLAYAYGSAAFGAGAADAPSLRAQGLQAAEHAAALNPKSSAAYRVMAWLQPPGAPYQTIETLLKKAISTPNTSCSCEHRDYGDFLLDVGRSFDSVGEYQRSVDINPGGSEYLSLAHAWYFTGQPDRAQEALDTVEANWGDRSWIGFLNVDNAISRKNWVQASLLTALDAQTEDDKILASTFAAVASHDAAAEAAALPTLERLARAPKLDAWKIRPPMLDERPALLLALTGHGQDALDAIERLMLRYGPDGGQLLFNPIVASLRKEPGYVRLVESSGLMRYWLDSHTSPDLCKAADAPLFCARLQ